MTRESTAPAYQTAPQRRSEPAEKSTLIQRGKVDVTFLSLVIVLLTIGLICLFSASYAYAQERYNDSYKFIWRQFLFAVVGVVVMLVLSRINCDVFRRFAWAIYAVSIGLLVLVLCLPAVANVHRWINIGPIGIQPSEIAKFAVALLFAHLISSNYRNMPRASFSVFFLGLLLVVPCALVFVEPHLSGTLLLFAIGAVLITIGGIKLYYVIIPLAGAVLLVILAVFGRVISYANSRIEFWLNPWSDTADKGYQTIQSLIAIGSGGVMGKGLGQSNQKQLYVPEPQNDFIFAIVCEELGLIGALFIILLFALLVWRGFTIAMRAPDKFRSLLAIGLTFCVGLQAALNVMVVTNTIPNTGISLPFFSYGGTALLITLAQMGIVLSISRSSTVNKA